MHSGSETSDDEYRRIFSGPKEPDPQPVEFKLQVCFLYQIAQAMAYLHLKDIIHLDLKSANCLLTRSYMVRVADFGLARTLDKELGNGELEGGTVEYLAPEILRGGKKTTKADVYSFGVVVWELCTGAVPWDGLDPFRVVASILYQDETLPTPTRAHPYMVCLFRACTATDPERRPTFVEVLKALEAEFMGILTFARLMPEPGKSLDNTPKRPQLTDGRVSQRNAGRGGGTES